MFEAIQSGLQGPPYDPFQLAALKGVRTRAVSGIRDARTIAVGQNRFVIEYNRAAPEARIRFSICHEIAHTFFPDCAETVRHRNSWHSDRRDSWQLEMLCNIAAAELLMPIGSFQNLLSSGASLPELTKSRKAFGASMEAILLRFVRLTEVPCFAFAAHKDPAGVVLEYCVPSRSCSMTPASGTRLKPGTVLEQGSHSGACLRNDEVWPAVGSVSVECTALAPHQSDHRARVAGIASLARRSGFAPQQCIKFVIGDATKPYGKGRRVIAHIVNDRSAIWGAGFGRAVRKKWPGTQASFRDWVLSSKKEFRLGATLTSNVDDEITVFHMVAQHGFGPSKTPRIRYAPLQQCLEKLAQFAASENATVHMPRIGCGEAGGSWPVIEELIEQEMTPFKLSVSVYDLPGKPFSGPQQSSLFEVKAWRA